MKIEAVTVSVDYADFLAESLPLNKPLFDRIVVVTTPEDHATQRICEYHHVECVTTRAFATHKGQFRKAAGINVGLAKLDKDAWVCHLDADMVLPAQTRQVLEHAELDPAVIYGADRNVIVGYEAWREHCRKPRIQQELKPCFVHVDTYKVGARLNVPKLNGYAPIGFFQLWNPVGSGVRSYPSKHEGADRTDMLFSTQWPRGKRGFIPEIVAYHLESEPAEMGANWRGRTTTQFAPAPRRKRTGLERAAFHLAWAGPTAIGGTALLSWLVAAIAMAVVLVVAFSLTVAMNRKPPAGSPGIPTVKPYFKP